MQKLRELSRPNRIFKVALNVVLRAVRRPKTEKSVPGEVWFWFFDITLVMLILPVFIYR